MISTYLWTTPLYPGVTVVERYDSDLDTFEAIEVRQKPNSEDVTYDEMVGKCVFVNFVLKSELLKNLNEDEKINTINGEDFKHQPEFVVKNGRVFTDFPTMRDKTRRNELVRKADQVQEK